jgi:selenide,water dikinase
MFPAKEYPNLLVGLEVSDDAAVYRISDELAIIAMGGEVVLALNVCGFPIDLPAEMVSEILRGGAEKVAEAGGALAGGHTVIDEEPKYGLAVVGFVHPDRVATKAAAKAGDVLILTKPLGVGIIAAALKREMARPDHVRAAVEVMKALNRKAARLMQQVGINAVTDITGFALLGHTQEMAEKSEVGIHLDLESLPFLEGAKGYAQEQIFPAGADRNQKCYHPRVSFAPSVPEWMQMLLYTPETSGGLLIAVPEKKLEELTALFDREGQSYWVVGLVVEGEGVVVS